MRKCYGGGGGGEREGCWQFPFLGVKVPHFWSHISLFGKFTRMGLHRNTSKSLPIVLGEEGEVTPISTQTQWATQNTDVVLFNEVNWCLLNGPSPLRSRGETVLGRDSSWTVDASLGAVED